MRTVELTRGQVAKVDDEDFKAVSKWKWNASWNTHTRSFYAHRQETIQDGNRKKRRSVSMHRFLMGLAFGDRRQVDHRNHDTLDNQRGNLKVVTQSENLMNREKPRNNTSGVKGVSFHKKSGKWTANLGKGGRQTYLGLFPSVDDASRAYQMAVGRLDYNFA